MMNTHDVVDEFVRAARSVGILVAPLDAAPWIEQFEHKLPARLPASFRSLVTRYAFPAFDVGALALFASDGRGGEDELSRAVFKDKVMAEVTHGAGYIQFARPSGGSYDPVCFDANGRVNNREFPVVRLDHEAILMNSRIVVRDRVAKSFLAFIRSVVEMNEGQYGKIISLSDLSDF